MMVSKGKLVMDCEPDDLVEETMVVVQSLEIDWPVDVAWWQWMSENNIGVMWATTATGRRRGCRRWRSGGPHVSQGT
jgi:hypothetical protein